MYFSLTSSWVIVIQSQKRSNVIGTTFIITKRKGPKMLERTFHIYTNFSTNLSWKVCFYLSSCFWNICLFPVGLFSFHLNSQVEFHMLKLTLQSWQCFSHLKFFGFIIISKDLFPCSLGICINKKEWKLFKCIKTMILKQIHSEY